MPLNPVVIAGSLSKEELEKSIQEIVKAVDSGMDDVSQKFDTKLAAIEENFKKAGTKIGTAFKDSFNAALGSSFDQLAAAMEKMSKASARGTNAANASGAVSGAKNKNITYPQDSIGELRQQIKELQTKLNYEKRSTDELQKQVDLLHQAKAELKTQTTTRTFSSIFGMPEKSATQIADKMKALRTVQVQNADESKKLQNEYQRLSQRQKELLGNTISLTSGNNALARSFGYIRNRLMYALTIGAVMNFVKQLYSVRAEYELLERSMGVLIDNFRRGSEIFNELNAMALKSPFTLVELGTAAKQLLAYNFAEDEVVDTTRRLADISAALGVPMERLVYNLGQIRAQTALTARDARDFANAGFAIVPMLAKMYTEQKKFGDEIVTTAQVYDMMSKKLVTYEDVMKVINQVTDEGGKFFDFQAKQAETLKVQLANLTLAWNNMLNDIASGHQTALNTPIKLVKSLFQNWRSVLSVTQSLIVAYGIYKTAILAVNSAHAATWALRLQVRWKQYTEAILAATGAMNKLKVAIGTSGIIGLASILAGVASYFLFFRDSAGEAADDIKRFGEAGAKAVRNVENLYTALSSINKTSGNYKKIMGELNQALEDYGLELVNENFTMEQLNANREKNIELLKQEALEREHLNNIEREREKYETSGKDERAKIEKTIASYGSAWEKYAPAISSIVANIFEENIDQVVGKTGHEFNQAARLILDKVREEIKKNPVLSLEIDEESLKRAVSLYNYNGIISNLTNLKLVKEATDANIAAENAYNEEQKKRIGTQTTLNDRIEQSSKLLLDAANDTDKFYRKINQIVKDYSGKNIIDFLVDVKTKVPDWMMRMGVEDLSRLAARFTSIASEASKEGFKQKNVNGTIWDVSDIYLRGALYAEALRQKTAKKEEEDTKKVKQKKDELGDALTKELQLITDIQKLYKEYTKAGVDSETAKNAAAKEYQKTLEQTNATLSKFGVQGLTGEQIATMDLRTMRDTYQSILDKVQSSPKAVEALEKAIRNLNVEITKEGQKTIIDSLNSELGKLKDEYELAVELDANPELGGVFADMMGLSKEELEKLPRDFEGVVRKLQNVVDKELGMGAFDVRSNLNKDVFDEWVKANKYSQDSELVGKLKALTEYANKVRLDETKKQIEDWNKLLEKYAEYEYKRNQILQTYERERATALKKGATQDVLDAIEREKDQKLAGLNFEQFQKSSTWLTATGDLATLTDSALGLLIKRLEEYKKKSKNLDPKQIKQINNALKNLRKEQRQGNPFMAIANAKDTAKEAWDTYQQEIDEYMGKLNKLNELEEKNGDLTLEQRKTRTELIETIAKLRSEQEKAGKISVKSLTEGISGMAGAISQASTLLADFFTQIGNSEAAENLKALSETLDKASQGAQVGSSFGKYGALIGGAVGLLTGLFSGWAEEWSGNARITEKIKESEKQLRRLEEVYKDLELVAEQAYGVETLGAQEALAANKKLQLAELQRQLQLEESRKTKYRDEEKIESFKSQIHELQIEISKSTQDIVNDMLGISSAGDEITNLVQVMIDAFRNGEDAMEAFSNEWDKMIDNMILKLLVSEYMRSEWDNIMKTLREKEQEFLAKSTQDYQTANTELGIISKMTDDEIAKRIAEQLGYTELRTWDRHEANEMSQRGNYTTRRVGESMLFIVEAWQQVSNEQIAAYRRMLEQQITNAESAGENAEEAYTRWSIDYLGEAGKELAEKAKTLIEGLGDYYTFGELSGGNNLSNLQQGIQSITEDTAGALEAYMNGVSQQVYLHSDLLTQIRDAVVGFNLDVQLGVQSQMLLQLQNNYIVIQSMQSMMENWTTPAGNGIRVEML